MLIINRVSYFSASPNYKQIGYAPINHVSVFYQKYKGFRSNGLVRIGSGEIEPFEGYYKENRVIENEIGVSYFNIYDNLLQYEIIAGLGKGQRKGESYHRSLDFYAFDYTSDFNKYYIQPTFSIVPNKYIDVTFFTRLSYYQQYNILSSFEQGDVRIPYQYEIVLDVNKHFSQFIIEPGIQMRLGIKNLKIIGQVSSDIVYNYYENNTYSFNNEQVNVKKIHNSQIFTIGISMNINSISIYKKIQKHLANSSIEKP
ncbi:MAG: hypothetical protein PF541_11880 [Prolixibacteraceae bacterium]|jgi:hypothetical protein|nr:hypothetical protein [Prolixibacteraceae bacterium]